MMQKAVQFMWREIRKIVMKLILLMLPFFVLLPLYCAFGRDFYMDEEYAMYHQQRTYLLQNDEKNSVLILGDSRAKADFVPGLLSEDTYNIALGGASAVEGYYSMKEYLSVHEAPETVIISYAPMHYMDMDTIWSRTIYFHNMSDQDLKELFQTAENYQDTEKLFIDEYQKEFLMYKFYMPNKYASALRKSGFFFRYDKTKEKNEQLLKDRGHSFYGVAEGSDSFNGEAKVADFEPSDLVDGYLGRTIELCEEHGIRVIVEQTPMNEASHTIITQDFKDHYRLYLAELQEKYPKAEISQNLYWYENQFFGDGDHLNEQGAAVYSEYIRSTYPEVFEK